MYCYFNSKDKHSNIRETSILRETFLFQMKYDLAQMVKLFNAVQHVYPAALPYAFQMLNRYISAQNVTLSDQLIRSMCPGIVSMLVLYYQCLCSPAYGANHIETKRLSQAIYEKIQSNSSIAKQLAHLNMLKESMMLSARNTYKAGLKTFQQSFLPMVAFHDPNFFNCLISEKEIRCQMLEGLSEIETKRELMGSYNPFGKLLCHTLLYMKDQHDYRSFLTQKRGKSIIWQKLYLELPTLFAQVRFLHEKTQFPAFLIDKIHAFYNMAKFSVSGPVKENYTVMAFMQRYEQVLHESYSVESYYRDSRFGRFLTAIKPIIGRSEKKSLETVSKDKWPLLVRTTFKDLASIKHEVFVDQVYSNSDRMVDLFSRHIQKTRQKDKKMQTMLHNALDSSYWNKNPVPTKIISQCILSYLLSEVEFNWRMAFLNLPKARAPRGVLLDILSNRLSTRMQPVKRKSLDPGKMFIKRATGVELQLWQLYEGYLNRRVYVQRFINANPPLLTALQSAIPINPRNANAFFHLCLFHAALKNKIKIPKQILNEIIAAIKPLYPSTSNAILRQLSGSEVLEPSMIVAFVSDYSGKARLNFNDCFNLVYLMVKQELLERKRSFSELIKNNKFLTSLSFEKVFCLYASLVLCGEKALINNSGIKSILVGLISANYAKMSLIRCFYDKESYTNEKGLVQFAKGLFLSRVALDDPDFLHSLLFLKGIPIVLQSDLIAVWSMPRNDRISSELQYIFLLTGILSQCYGDKLLHLESSKLNAHLRDIKGVSELKMFDDSAQSIQLLEYINTGISVYKECLSSSFKCYQHQLEAPDLSNVISWELDKTKRQVLSLFYKQLELLKSFGVKMQINDSFLKLQNTIETDVGANVTKNTDNSALSNWGAVMFAGTRENTTYESSGLSNYSRVNQMLFEQYILNPTDDFRAFMNDHAKATTELESVQLLLVIYRLRHQKAASVAKLVSKFKRDHIERLFLPCTLSGALGHLEADELKQMYGELFLFAIQYFDQNLSKGALANLLLSSNLDAENLVIADLTPLQVSKFADIKFRCAIDKKLRANALNKATYKLHVYQADPVENSHIEFDQDNLKSLTSVLTYLCAMNDERWRTIVSEAKSIEMIDQFEQKNRNSNVIIYLLAIANLQKNHIDIELTQVDTVLASEDNIVNIWDHLIVAYELGVVVSVDAIENVLERIKPLMASIFEPSVLTQFCKAIDRLVELYDAPCVDEKVRAILLPAIKFVHEQAGALLEKGYYLNLIHRINLVEAILSRPTNRGGGAGPGVTAPEPTTAMLLAPKPALTTAHPPRIGKQVLLPAMADLSDDSSDSSDSDASGDSAKRRMKAKAKARPKTKRRRANPEAGSSFAFAGAGVSPGAVEANPALSPLLLQRWTLESDYDSDLGSIDPSDLFDNLDKP